MRTQAHPKKPARRALWMGALGIVLAGLFGMHGLDNHGMPGMEASHDVIPGPQATVSGEHEVTATPATHDEGSARTAVSVTSGHPAMDLGMEVACMAILAMALLALLRRLRAPSSHRVLWMLTQPVRAPSFMGRDPDPPCLIALSIQRC